MIPISCHFGAVLRETETMKIARFAAIVLAMMTASLAYAADTNASGNRLRALHSTPVASWAGPYVELGAGYTAGVLADNPRPIGPSGTLADLKPSGMDAFGRVGVNWQVRDLVFGPRIGFHYVDASGSREIAWSPTFSERTTYSLKWYGTADLLVGYDLGRFLPYVFGGGAVGQFNQVSTFTLTVPVFSSTTDTTVYGGGWRVGAGFKYALGRERNWLLGFEYAHTSFDVSSTATTSTFGGFRADRAFEIDSALASITYRWN